MKHCHQGAKLGTNGLAVFEIKFGQSQRWCGQQQQFLFVTGTTNLAFFFWILGPLAQKIITHVNSIIENIY
jgi:hypothetical protein